MRFTSISVTNYKSIQRLDRLPLGQVTILIGANNAGKSSLVQALYSFQAGSPHCQEALRVGETALEVSVTAEQMVDNPWTPQAADPTTVTLSYREGRVDVRVGQGHHVNPIPQTEPKAFIYPQLGKRKVSAYGRQVDRSSAISVVPNWQNLVSRLQRLANPDFPGSDAYRTACEGILGFVVTVFPSDGGQQAGRYVSQTASIAIEDMGEGVASVVALLVDLASAKNKLILIEEPENDLHPQALKALLRLMLESADYNQIVVTTHSNIVLRYLGSHKEAVIHRVAGDPKTLPPVTSFETVAATPEARLEVLRELGYELADFDLYDGWLILEESSAEQIVRQHLLRWFAPGLLGRVRTMSARGTGNVEATFEDFSRLFLFAHLEPAYRQRAWVVVDGDPSGVAVIDKLAKRFSDAWPAEHFISLVEHDFELYYPAQFHERALELLALSRGDERRSAKAALLNDVLGWIEGNEAEAQAAFATSAAEVVALLQRFEAELT